MILMNRSMFTLCQQTLFMITVCLMLASSHCSFLCQNELRVKRRFFQVTVELIVLVLCNKQYIAY